MPNTFSKFINNSDNFLIVTPVDADIDLLVAAYALLKGLTAVNKKVSFYFPDLQLPKLFHDLQLQNLKITNLNETQQLKVTLENFDSWISDVKWKNFEKHSEIELLMNSIPKNPLELKYSFQNFAGLITFDQATFDLAPLKALANTSQILRISNQQNTPNKSLTFNEPKISYSQLVYQFMKEVNLPIKRTACKFLIAGIYQGTNSLQNNINANTFKALADLTSQNISITEAIAMVIPQTDAKQPIKTQPLEPFMKFSPRKNKKNKQFNSETNPIQVKLEEQVVREVEPVPVMQLPISPIAPSNIIDPLAPAKELPIPLNLREVQNKPIESNTPLPPAR
ncbi:MAG: hypothetical protein WCJ58_06060 [bacterium]